MIEHEQKLIIRINYYLRPKVYQNRTDDSAIYDGGAGEKLNGLIQYLWLVTDVFTYWPQTITLLALAIER